MINIKIKYLILYFYEIYILFDIWFVEMYWNRSVYLVHLLIEIFFLSIVVTENGYRHYHHDRIVYVPPAKPNMFGLPHHHHQYGGPPPPPSGSTGAPGTNVWQNSPAPAHHQNNGGGGHLVATTAAAAGSPANNNGGVGIGGGDGTSNTTGGHLQNIANTATASSPTSNNPGGGGNGGGFYPSAAAAAAAAAMMWPNPSASAFQAHHYGKIKKHFFASFQDRFLREDILFKFWTELDVNNKFG